ncbi:MAG: NAD-dependent epimerase/dehydratase family protein [Candidatus Binatia bacterium]
MKVLVTGGTGFLGRNVVRRLLDGGDVVRVLVRPSRTGQYPHLAILNEHGRQAAAEEVIGDLCDSSSLRQVLDGIEAVCHCAARVQVGGSWSDFKEVNIRGTERLLEEACRERIKRFLHVSTLGVYGLDGQETTITEESPLDEGNRGYYTRSKIESERLIWKYSRERDLPVTVIRPGILYGPGKPPFVSRPFVALGPKLRIAIARPEQRLPLTYVENVAEAIHLALHSNRAIGRAYNVVDEAVLQEDYLALLSRVGLNHARTILLPPTPIYLLLSLSEHFCRWLGVAPPVSRDQFQRALASILYDTSRAREELGWSPKVGMAEALSKIREARA